MNLSHFIIYIRKYHSNRKFTYAELKALVKDYYGEVSNIVDIMRSLLLCGIIVPDCNNGGIYKIIEVPKKILVAAPNQCLLAS